MRVKEYGDDNFPFISVSAFYDGERTDHTFIECDQCGQTWGIEGSDQEAGLLADGWTTQGADRCPDCNGVPTDSDGNPYHTGDCCKGTSDSLCGQAIADIQKGKQS